MIYIPIFVNIVLLLLFGYRYLFFSLFSEPSGILVGIGFYMRDRLRAGREGQGSGPRNERNTQPGRHGSEDGPCMPAGELKVHL